MYLGFFLWHIGVSDT